MGFGVYRATLKQLGHPESKISTVACLRCMSEGMALHGKALPIVSIVVPIYGSTTYYIKDPKRKPQKKRNYNGDYRYYMLAADIRLQISVPLC